MHMDEKGERGERQCDVARFLSRGELRVGENASTDWTSVMVPRRERCGGSGPGAGDH
jgi:hypothetical protein